MTRYTARGQFENGAMEQQTLGKWSDGLELTRIWFPTAYMGDIEGQGVCHVLYAARGEEAETVCAIERVEGSVGGRRGTFVDQQEATPDGAKWTGRWWIVDGMGTGDLRGLRGEGHMEIAYSQTVGSWTLEWWFD